MFRPAINCSDCSQKKKKTCSICILFDLSERLTFRDVQSPQEFRHGETAEVVCDVISSPVPVVVWYYQDKEITEEHHSKFSWPSFAIFLTLLLFCCCFLSFTKRHGLVSLINKAPDPHWHWLLCYVLIMFAYFVNLHFLIRLIGCFFDDFK